MITRKSWGRTYKLVASTEERVGMVLMAIRLLDIKFSKKKRKRVKITKNIDEINNNIFEIGLVSQLKNFKQTKQITV